MSEINEELIEQARAIADKYATATLKFEDRVDEEMMASFRAEAQIDRRGIIALAELFLSAVRNGDLDEALGVVGRAVWVKEGDEDHIYDWVADVIENGVRTFIALRPEKGEKE